MITIHDCDVKVTEAIHRTRLASSNTQIFLRKQVDLLKHRLQRASEEKNNIQHAAAAQEKASNYIRAQQLQLQKAQATIHQLTSDLTNQRSINREMFINLDKEIRTVKALKQDLEAVQQQAKHIQTTKQRTEAAKVFQDLKKKTTCDASTTTHPPPPPPPPPMPPSKQMAELIQQAKGLQLTHNTVTSNNSDIVTADPAKTVPDQLQLNQARAAITSATMSRPNEQEEQKPVLQLTTDILPTDVPVNVTVVPSIARAYTVTFTGAIGVQIGDLGRIELVNSGSSADDAGVNVGDTIAHIDGVPLTHVFA